MENRTCTKCRGKGSFLPPNAFISEWKTCHICAGVGHLPVGYVIKKEPKKRKRVRYVRKTDGLDDLKGLGE